MKFPSVFIGLGAILMLASLAVHAESAVPPPAAKPGPCALLKPDDLTALLGAAPVSKLNKGACLWTIADKPNKLAVSEYPGTGMAADMAFSTARTNAGKAGPVTNVLGVGDRAFARTGPFGVAMLIIQQGKLLQLLYSSGTPGTDKDIEALKPVAKIAIAAFK